MIALKISQQETFVVPNVVNTTLPIHKELCDFPHYFLKPKKQAFKEGSIFDQLASDVEYFASGLRTEVKR